MARGLLGDTMTKRNPTKKERQELCSELSKNFGRWMALDDKGLLLELRVHMPSVTTATREECLKFLVMDHVYRMVGLP